MGKKNNPGWSCIICSYSSGRKWNLERHYEKVHQQMPNPQQKLRHWNRPATEQVPRVSSELDEIPWPYSESWFQRVGELSKHQNRIANSKQTFNRVNFLESRVNTLENQLRQLYQHNWIIPRLHVQGLNGHICYLCNTFNFRLVMDLGYDLTMQSKHNCYKQVGAFTIPIPQEVLDIDTWAAEILFNQMSYFESIGNRLELVDITKKFIEFGKYEYRDIIFGIPDRHPLITIEENFMTDLIDNVNNSPENRILMLDSQILQLLTKTKSTYGILELPQHDNFLYYYMRIVR